MRSEKRALRYWAVLTLVLGCLGAAAVFTSPAYAHDIIAWGWNSHDVAVPLFSSLYHAEKLHKRA